MNTSRKKIGFKKHDFVFGRRYQERVGDTFSLDAFEEQQLSRLRSGSRRDRHVSITEDVSLDYDYAMAKIDSIN